VSRFLKETNDGAVQMSGGWLSVPRFQNLTTIHIVIYGKKFCCVCGLLHQEDQVACKYMNAASISESSEDHYCPL